MNTKLHVVMDSVDRELCGLNVRQRTKDEYLCLEDVSKVINIVRVQSEFEPSLFVFRDWIKQKGVSEFIEALEFDTKQKAYTLNTKTSPGWIHPFLALKMLTHFNPKFEVQVYKWLYDYLIRNRISSADTFNRMNGALFSVFGHKEKYPRFIVQLNTRINNYLGITSRQTATQEQLKALTVLQEKIADAAMIVDDAVIGVEQGFRIFEMQEIAKSFIKPRLT